MDSRTRTQRRKEAAIAKLPPSLRLFSLTDLEEVLGVTHRTLQNYIKSGRLKGVKIGGKWRVSEDNLRLFVNGNG